MKPVINPKYTSLRPFVEQLATPGFFDSNGTLLHAGRNTIRAFDYNGVKLAVKRYGHLTLFNRFIYGRLRKSKAERTYLHARRLRQAGIDTPEEVAYLEIRRHLLLDTSYFVSLCSPYSSAQTLTDLRSDAKAKLPAHDALAAFLHRIHSAGILHKDLNITNILYHDDGDRHYSFQLIDINRMQFCKRLSIRQKLRNLRQLSCPAPAFLYLLDRYAEIDHSDINTIQLRGVAMRLLFDAWQRTRHRMKAFLKKL